MATLPHPYMAIQRLSTKGGQRPPDSAVNHASLHKSQTGLSFARRIVRKWERACGIRAFNFRH